jgi:hypothetical protein
MRTIFLSTIFFAVTGGVYAADSSFDSLWLYQGSFDVTMNIPGSKPVSNKIQNDCADFGQYFVCQQTVDGKVVALLIFTPGETKGHYYTNPMFPNGRVAGRGDLELDGDRWTYPSKEEENGVTKYYKITNVFSGKDRIHFERSESADGKTWTTLATGDEVRTSRDGTRPDPRPHQTK